ncbi:MAG: YbbR-like domain-containing protein [Bacillota bacterium]
MKLPVARDLHLRIAALLLAIVVWFVAGADIRRTQGDTVEKIITVGMEVRGVAPNLIITAKPKDVEVRVRGPRHVVEPLDGSRVRAFVSVAGRGEGEHGVRVQASAPDGVQVMEIMPSSTSVTVEAVIGRDMPVVVALVGFPSDGYVPLQPGSTPRSVTIAGPRSRVEAVRSALAQIDISGVAAGVSRDVAVVPVDGSGSQVEGVSAYPASARITVPVQARAQLAPSATGSGGAGAGAAGQGVSGASGPAGGGASSTGGGSGSDAGTGNSAGGASAPGSTPGKAPVQPNLKKTESLY